MARGESLAEIARRLARPTSTVAREVARNGGRHATRAQGETRMRAARPRVRKVVASVALAAVVAEGLARRWSPGEVAARLAVDHPDDEAMRVSHETIYASLHVQGRGGLKEELIAALRSGRLRRRPRQRGGSARRASVLGDIEPVSVRPPEADDRAVPGHWEGDLIMGAFSRFRDRDRRRARSRLLVLGELPDGHDAQGVYECLLDLVGDLPDVAPRSLTWDQGREMANWVQLEVDAGIEVYFCDPHSPVHVLVLRALPWRLRQYLPKGTDLNNVTRRQLHAVAIENERAAPQGRQLEDPR